MERDARQVKRKGGEGEREGAWVGRRGHGEQTSRNREGRNYEEG